MNGDRYRKECCVRDHIWNDSILVETPARLGEFDSLLSGRIYVAVSGVELRLPCVVHLDREAVRSCFV